MRRAKEAAAAHAGAVALLEHAEERLRVARVEFRSAERSHAHLLARAEEAGNEARRLENERVALGGLPEDEST